MKWIVIFLLLSAPALAQTIADYPDFLFDADGFNAYIITGDLLNSHEIAAATLIAKELRVDSIYEKIHQASEIHLLDKPAIIIGTPCTNEYARKALKFANCNQLPAYEGYILLGTYNGTLVLLVTGGSPQAVLSAAKWLNSGAHRAYFSRSVVLRNAYQIGNGDLLTIGRPIGEVTEAIIGPRQTVRYTSVGSYLRFGKDGGRVIFGERDR